MNDLRACAAGLVDALNPHVRSTVRVLNDQIGRREIVEEIVRQVSIEAIVETGTYRGGTTSFLAKLVPAPVLSVEAHPRFYWSARWRLWPRRNARLFLGDSRTILRRLSADPTFPRASLLFYLDAHCSALPGVDDSEPLPLRDEFEIVARNWSDSVVMIDDFEVPDDPGYGYDDYGPSNALRLDLIRDLLTPEMSLYYPSLPATEETGARRGAIVICIGRELGEAMDGLSSLRRAESP